MLVIKDLYAKVRGTNKEIIKGFEENRLIHKLCKTCGFIDKFK